MRKAISTLLTLTMGLGIVSCAAKAPAAEEGFRPALDTSTSCQINIAGEKLSYNILLLYCLILNVY